MSEKSVKLKTINKNVEEALNKTNERIECLGEYSGELSDRLGDIQKCFDEIRNIPSETEIEYERIKKIRIEWKQQVEKIEGDYKAAVAKDIGGGAAGAMAGVGVMAFGPTAAMGIATTFGVASTGTAISTLSGAAATNAALAWLGGGALATGGGGMAGGNALLALAGPVGWAIAGVALLTSGVLFWKNRKNKKRLDRVFSLIGERDIKKYDLATVELNERIERIKEENGLLKDAIEEIRGFGLDYSNMTEEQQYKLGAYVNLMSSSTQLLVKPILGLQPKYLEEDYNFVVDDEALDPKVREMIKRIVIWLANLLYKIDLDDTDKKLLSKSFRKNRKLRKQLEVEKFVFSIELMNLVEQALECKYGDQEKIESKTLKLVGKLQE